MTDETVTPEYVRARWSERSDVYDHVITHGDDVYRDLHRLADALEAVQAERDDALARAESAEADAEKWKSWARDEGEDLDMALDALLALSEAREWKPWHDRALQQAHDRVGLDRPIAALLAENRRLADERDTWKWSAEKISTAFQRADNRAERLADELKRVREVLDSLTDDDVWAEIDDTARATLRQHLRSIRGQMVTPADGIEWHVMQDVRRRIKGALSTTEPQGEQPKPDTTEQAGTYTSAQE